MGTYDTRGGAPLSPPDEEPGSAEIELTGAEWTIIMQAVQSYDGPIEASDRKDVLALVHKLFPFQGAKGAHIVVWE
jgi:hypothetical protein